MTGEEIVKQARDASKGFQLIPKVFGWDDGRTDEESSGG